MGEAAKRFEEAVKKLHEKDEVSSRGLPSEEQRDRELQKAEREEHDRELEREFHQAEESKRIKESQRKARQDQFNADREEARKAREAAEAESARTLKKQQDVAAALQKKLDADEAKARKEDEDARREIFKRQEAVKDALNKKLDAEDRAVREREARMASEKDDLIAKLRKETTPKGRAEIRRQIDDLPQKYDTRIASPVSKSLSASSIRDSIRGTAKALPSRLDTFAVGMFGGAANAVVAQRNSAAVNKSVRQEGKMLSGAVRNRNLGKNPFASVIGVGGRVSQMYVTDGHGRSGRRATLEWRREHRQYTSPERKAAAQTNPNWLANITGTEPAPVRHRKTGRRGNVLSPLQRLGRLI